MLVCLWLYTSTQVILELFNPQYDITKLIFQDVVVAVLLIIIIMSLLGSLVAEEELEQVKPQFGDVQVFYSSIKKSTVEVIKSCLDGV